jgi:hypothetical protein
MSAITGLVVSPEFSAFLKQLGKKKEGEPFISWLSHIDCLLVLIGDGDCREYLLAGFAAPHLDSVLKLDPKEEEDPFAGFEISGGIQRLIQQNYREQFGTSFCAFAASYNKNRVELPASELLEMWLAEFPATKPEQVERIREALKHQNPSIHIPL